MDILIQEMGSGGEIAIRNNDIVMVEGYENQPLLASFGGEKWWGNGLLITRDAEFNATTERVLNETPLSSAGLIAIEGAMLDDLKYLENIAGTQVAVNGVIAAPNRLNVSVNISGETFYLNWNPDSSFLNYSLTE